MKALGYRVVNPTSPRRKQHTAVAYGDRVVVHYGPVGVAGQYRDNVANGGTNVLSNKVRALYEDKTSPSKGYTLKEAPFQVVELSIPADATPQQIVDAFLGAADSTVSLSVVSACGDFNSSSARPAPVSPAAPPTARATPVADRGCRLRVEGPVLRPNGETYRPRDLAGHDDVALLRRLREVGINARLFGPPGSGKTALVEAAFGDCITINGHGDLTVANFVGNLLPTPNGGWEWVSGPLAQAMLEDKMLFVDEITRIPTEVLAVLYSVMDGRGVLRIDDRPDIEPIQAGPNFGVIAGYNPDTLGARELDEALVSRFKVPIEVVTDFDMARTMGVPTKAVRLAQNLNTMNEEDRLNEGPGVWVPQMRELLTFRDLMHAGMDESFAVSVLVGSCPRPMDLPTVRDAAKLVFGYDIAPLRTGGAAR